VRPWAVLPSAIAAIGAAAALAGACLDGGRAYLTVLPGQDATMGDDDGGTVEAGDELVVSSTCGPAPWVNVGIYVVALSLLDPDASTPLAGAEFTSPLCPGIKQQSDEGGNIHGQISANTPFYGRLTDDPSISPARYIPMLAPEEKFDADVSGIKISMLPVIIETFVPNIDPSMPTIAISLQHNGGMGACDQFDGVSFSVPGHPEAMVLYLSNDTIPKIIQNGTATSTRGLALITGLATNQLVTPAAAKPNCQVTFVKDGLTGRVPLESGYVSIAPAYLGN
jgi:hypothetical protein